MEIIQTPDNIVINAGNAGLIQTVDSPLARAVIKKMMGDAEGDIHRVTEGRRKTMTFPHPLDKMSII